jgi:phosphate starvation-inducible protein PhoH
MMHRRQLMVVAVVDMGPRDYSKCISESAIVFEWGPIGLGEVVVSKECDSGAKPF